MEFDRTTFGRDLHLEIDPSRGRRIGIEDALRTAIRTGRLREGTVLPSTRTLAVDLGIARGTAVEAYGQLVAEGYLESQAGSSTRVVWVPDGPIDGESQTAGEPTVECRFNWRAGTADVSSFPRREWLRALGSAVRDAPDDAFALGDPRGDPRLRTVLCDYVARARGVDTDPQRIVITNGYTEALVLTARALRMAGARQVATEDPGIVWNRTLFENAGLRARALPVDDQGARIGELTARDHAAVLTPAHQFPLGVALDPLRRTELVDWAKSGGRTVIEDDYDGEFRYDRQPIGALQALAPGHVAYIGTTSKTIAPGLRLGWLIAPPDLLDAIIEAKRLTNQHTSTIEQLALAHFISTGAFDRHLRRMRLHYRRRRDQVLRTLRDAAPSIRVSGIAAGLHLVLNLPEGGPTESEVEQAGMDAGILLRGLHSYSSHDLPGQEAIVLGYGTPPTHSFTAALESLAMLLGNLY